MLVLCYGGLMRKINVLIAYFMHLFTFLESTKYNLPFELTFTVIVESGLFCNCGALRTEQN